MRILLVEDDDTLAKAVEVILEQHGYQVQRAANGSEARAARNMDLVLLDLGLPDIDGMELCRELRRRSGVPIIIVTARDDDVDRVVGLELGADDYVCKPFNPRELVARVKAVLRRATSASGAVDQIEVASLRIDQRAMRASIDGRVLSLSPKEYELLRLLASEPGAVVTRKRILAEVWRTTWPGFSKTLDVHVASLRRKLGNPNMVETVRGVGFRLAADDPTSS